MAEAKIYSVQPRFTGGDTHSGWAFVNNFMTFDNGIPPYGSPYRDAWLAKVWQDEPMLAGVFNTFIEKTQTTNWTVTGGKQKANYYARLLNTADNGAGWTVHEGWCVLDYLSTDKGRTEELERDSVTPAIKRRLQELATARRIGKITQTELTELDRLLAKATSGKVVGLNHLDSTRMVRVGLPGMRWRYFPDTDKAVSVPDENLLQGMQMPSGRDQYRGYGHCTLSRVLEAKTLMAAYLTYFRQEIGNLPPELVFIINGMDQSTFAAVLEKYKLDREAAGLDIFSKILWLGSDDAMTPVDVTTVPLTSPSKAFSYESMVEWYMKLLSLNTGEPVSEYWVITHTGSTKAFESIQQLKTYGKGAAKYLVEKERQLNRRVMPFGVRFEYDNADDAQDKRKAEILAMNIDSVSKLATLGVDRQDPVLSVEEIRDMLITLDILPASISGLETPTELGAKLKEISDPEDSWTVHRDGKVVQNIPLLKGREARKADWLYNVLKEQYSVLRSTDVKNGS